MLATTNAAAQHAPLPPPRPTPRLDPTPARRTDPATPLARLLAAGRTAIRRSLSADGEAFLERNRQRGCE